MKRGTWTTGPLSRHAVQENGWHYWWSLIRRDLRYYLGPHYTGRNRVAALARTAWWLWIIGYFGERCQDCGRLYLHWHAPDDLYARVTGNPKIGGTSGGLFCLECFDRRARVLGLTIMWVPTMWIDDNVPRLPDGHLHQYPDGSPWLPGHWNELRTG